MTPEGKVKAKVKQVLNDIGAYHIWPVPTGYGSAMVDCYGCYRGRFFAVECKATATARDKLTPRQKLIMQQVRQAGGMTFVVDAGNVDTFIINIIRIEELVTQ